jgi:hypothetical protein
MSVLGRESPLSGFRANRPLTAGHLQKVVFEMCEVVLAELGERVRSVGGLELAERVRGCDVALPCGVAAESCRERVLQRVGVGGDDGFGACAASTPARRGGVVEGCC